MSYCPSGVLLKGDAPVRPSAKEWFTCETHKTPDPVPLTPQSVEGDRSER